MSKAFSVLTRILRRPLLAVWLAGNSLTQASTLLPDGFSSAFARLPEALWLCQPLRPVLALSAHALPAWSIGELTLRGLPQPGNSGQWIKVLVSPFSKIGWQDRSLRFLRGPGEMELQLPTAPPSVIHSRTIFYMFLLILFLLLTRTPPKWPGHTQVVVLGDAFGETKLGSFV